MVTNAVNLMSRPLKSSRPVLRNLKGFRASCVCLPFETPHHYQLGRGAETLPAFLHVRGSGPGAAIFRRPLKSSAWRQAVWFRVVVRNLVPSGEKAALQTRFACPVRVAPRLLIHGSGLARQEGFIAARQQRFGWGARIRTWGWRYQKPLPYRLAKPQCAGGSVSSRAGRREH